MRLLSTPGQSSSQNLVNRHAVSGQHCWFARSKSFYAVLALLFFSLVPCNVSLSQNAAPLDVSGIWKGELGDGSAKLHLVVTISHLSGGELTGQVEVSEQGANLTLEAITLKGDTLRFEVKAVGGVYEGKLNAAGTEADGTWTQTNVPAQKLVLQKQPAGQPAEKVSGPKTKPFVVAFDTQIPIAPTAFQGDGKTHLVYEIHFINMDRWDDEITKFEVLAADSTSRPLLQLSGSQLEAALGRPGKPAGPKARFAPGAAGFLFVWVTLDRPSDVPSALTHRFTVKVGDFPEEQTLQTQAAPVSTGLVTITPPLRGDHWVAANGPGNASGHRRALIPIDGRAMIGQRFAIDWVKLGDEGKTFHGDAADNNNYYAHGVEALAVADGVVTEIKDGLPENVPGENSRAVPITLETVAGNHVILEISKGVFAFYAHLQPGSLRVKLGDKVRRGQVIGLVGNTGNSTEPHLHFHLSNANSPLGSEGLPYALPSFEVQGHGWTWKPTDTKTPPEKHSNELPLEGEVVRFP